MTDNIIYKYNDLWTDNTLIIHYSDSFYGLAIIDSKKVNRKKAREWEHILLKQEEFDKFLNALSNNKRKTYIECTCGLEALSITYKGDENLFYLMLFDNYFSECPKFVKDEICITEKDANYIVEKLKGFHSPSLSKT